MCIGRGKGLSVRWDLGEAFNVQIPFRHCGTFIVQFLFRHCGTYSRPQMIPKDKMVWFASATLLIYILSKIRDLFYSTMRNSECDVTFYIGH